MDKFGEPRTLCYCGNPLTTADVMKIETFLEKCKENAREVKFEPGQVHYPEHLSLNMGQSAAYVVAVDIRYNPLPAERVISRGTPQSQPIWVKCVLGARLVPVGQSLEVDNKGWIPREFTPTGVLNWSWSITALAPYDHDLRLELEPAVTTQDRPIFTQIDSSPTIDTFITHVHVKASWIQHVGHWWKNNWTIILGVSAAIGAALISIIKWGGNLGQTVQDASAKWRGKQKQDNRPEG